MRWLTTSTGVGIATAAAFLLVCGLAVRVVSEHERVVVHRLGRFSRVQGPGLVVHMPGIERIRFVSLLPSSSTLVVTVPTREGVQVRLLGHGEWRVVDPASTTSATPDVVSATATAIEDALARTVPAVELAALVDERRLLTNDVAAAVSTVTARWGVHVDVVEIRDVEIRLTAELLEMVRRRDATER